MKVSFWERQGNSLKCSILKRVIMIMIKRICTYAKLNKNIVMSTELWITMIKTQTDKRMLNKK